MTPPKTSSRMQVFCLFLLGLVFFCLGAFELPNTFAVIRSQSVVNARVVDSRVMATKYGLSYEVRYAFSLGSAAPEFVRSDYLGRSDLWSTLPEDAWREAVATQRLQVRYDPKNPGNNGPDVSLPSVWDSLTPIILGVFILGIAVATGRMRRKQLSLMTQRNFQQHQARSLSLKPQGSSNTKSHMRMQATVPELLGATTKITTQVEGFDKLDGPLSPAELCREEATAADGIPAPALKLFSPPLK